MPTSNLEVIEPIMRLAMDVNPKSVLDIGCGFGKYGFLCREYLEVVKNGVVKKEDWKVKINAIEGFSGYIGSLQREVYDHIMIRDIADTVKEPSLLLNTYVRPVTPYELYIMTDVLEHLVYWKDVLNVIPDTHLLVTVPDGFYHQDASFGNDFERHVNYFNTNILIRYFDHVTVVKDTILCLRGARWR